jgi:hypothetical protein
MGNPINLIMKKLFLLALSVTFFVSCSDDAPVTNVAEETSVEVARDYDDIFAKYSNFTIDGIITTDKTKIKEVLQTAAVSSYLPEKRTIHFFSTKNKFADITNISLAKLESYEETDEDIFNPGKNFDEEGASPFKLNADGANAKSSFLGISGLGNLANNSTYTGFANRTYFYVKYTSSNNSYICRSNESHSDLWSGPSSSPLTSARMSGSTGSVSTVNMNMGVPFRNLFSYNNVEISVKNDQGFLRHVFFFENTNYGGRVNIVSLSKDQVYNFGRYYFDNFSSNRPKSLKLLNDDEYTIWFFDGILP